MTLYFSGCLTQKPTFGLFYRQIVHTLEQWHHTVLQDSTQVDLQEAVNKSDSQRVDYYRQVLHWVNQADCVVVECSFPSTLSIGHEISLALDKGKPVIALYYQDYEPAFLLGLQHPRLFWSDYTEDNITATLEEGLRFATIQQQIRFNFFITSKHTTFLDDVAQKYNMPRSAYMRQLIEDDMERRKKR
jgi:hypothetical protein